MKVVFLDAAASGRIDTPPQQDRIREWRYGPRAVLSQISATLSEWRRRRRVRIELAMLDDRMLSDIGVSRADIWREINKPFWRK